MDGRSAAAAATQLRAVQQHALAEHDDGVAKPNGRWIRSTSAAAPQHEARRYAATASSRRIQTAHELQRWNATASEGRTTATAAAAQFRGYERHDSRDAETTAASSSSIIPLVADCF